MTFDFFPFGFVLNALILVLLIAFQWRQRHSPGYLLFFTFIWIYVLIVLDIVIFPLSAPPDWPQNISLQSTWDVLSHINLLPFNFGYLFYASTYVIIEQLAGNILVTIPIGFGIPILFPISDRRIPWQVLFCGLILESVQLAAKLLGLLSGYGHSIDINDVILNTLGVLIGYGFFRLFARMKAVLFHRYLSL